ncbi:hypothetical protein RvY_18141 [Ramazzottius varieornatus]|uniref:Uncharacterized protein n=1 Tax=Ramazzottius varieornatus TaxID=947166 RepID=A0A1D1W4P7_RAMVA|nr:hypothetical protein RvY_18141 [Ramazzottius varieornatus]
MEFDSASTPACYRSRDEDITIQQDDEIRVKIVGTRVDAKDIFAIGTCTVKCCGLEYLIVLLDGDILIARTITCWNGSRVNLHLLEIEFREIKQDKGPISQETA